MSTLAPTWRHSPGRGLRDRRPVPPLLAAEGRRSVPVLRDADDALLLGHDHGHIHHLLGPLDPLQQDGLAGQRLGLDLRRHREEGARRGCRRQPRRGAGLRRPLGYGHKLRQGLWVTGAGRRGPAIIAWPPVRERLRAPGLGHRNRHDPGCKPAPPPEEGAESWGAEPGGGGACRRGWPLVGARAAALPEEWRRRRGNLKEEAGRWRPNARASAHWPVSAPPLRDSRRLAAPPLERMRLPLAAVS